MVIPPIQPDLLAWAKRCAYRAAGVRWRGNVVLIGAHFLGACRCGRCIICWGWLHEQGQERCFVLADGLAYVIGEDTFGRVDGDVLSLNGEVHAFGTEF